MRVFLIFACWLASAMAFAAADDAARFTVVRDAFARAETGRLDADTRHRLAKDPLLPWIEYAALHRDLTNADPAAVRDFLARHDDQAAARLLREEWLAELDRRRDWKNFRAFYVASTSESLRCADLAARLDAGDADSKDRAAAWTDDALALWQTGDALSADCDAAFAQLDARGKLTAELHWKRITAAAEDATTSVMRSAARGLPSEQAQLANGYATFIESPNDKTTAWPPIERSRRIVIVGLTRLARRDPAEAATLLAKLAGTLQMSEADRGRVLYAAALWAASSYLPDAAKRLAAVPVSAFDARLREWQVREALARGDDDAALKAIVAMDPAQRDDPHWEYFEARLRERAGDAKAANVLYAQAARTATYHGFLAADRLKQNYSICPVELHAGESERASVAASPALIRAFELFQVDRIPWAEREWKQALSGFDDHQRQIAVALAQDAGWYDRAAFALGPAASNTAASDELRLYALRFPLPHANAVQEQARLRAIDPSWIAAEIRAESVWMPLAHSAADARGLMQLLPSVGAHLARKQGIAWSGGDTLYQPLTNITLGAAYLRQMLDRFDGRTYLAIGAYDAGTAPVDRWLAQRPRLDPDFWIETVNYKETRDYISRVLAFSVIYDWRLSGKAVPLTDRMLGRSVPDAKRRGFACATAAVATPAATPTDAMR
jgi:soluble lytic murein transglycosylase